MTKVTKTEIWQKDLQEIVEEKGKRINIQRGGRGFYLARRNEATRRRKKKMELDELIKVTEKRGFEQTKSTAESVILYDGIMEVTLKPGQLEKVKMEITLEPSPFDQYLAMMGRVGDYMTDRLETAEEIVYGVSQETLLEQTGDTISDDGCNVYVTYNVEVESAEELDDHLYDFENALIYVEI